MAAFRKGTINFLVATDVAARGIDINDLAVVINFDFPRFGEDYVHRIGRTGRAGREGFALSFISRNELEPMRKTARMKKLSLSEAEIPDLQAIQKQILKSIKNDISNIDYDDRDKSLSHDFLKLCQGMDLDEEEIFSLLLKYLADKKLKNLNPKVHFEKPSFQREKKHPRNHSNNKSRNGNHRNKPQSNQFGKGRSKNFNSKKKQRRYS